jgi:hypothetical protein
MSVYKINESLATTSKISTLNDMVIEVDGEVSKGQFTKNEITQIIADMGMDRKYLRDQSLGHTLTAYTGWTHLSAESGYSIWKYSPTNYTYNSLNELYLDGKLLENRLEADSESATAFDTVYLYNGDSGVSYINNTTEAGTENGVSFELMDSSNDYLYVGLSTTFSGISFEFEDKGSNYTLYAEFWNGSVWTDLDISATTYVDDTSNFESDGRIYFTIPGNWAATTVNSVSKYWVRLSTTTTPVTVAKAYLVVPANSVPNLLKLSSSEILNEEWAWCSYTTAIYVTIRNSGNSAYEGNYYITSSSTAVNKQNYFIHNHEFTSNYEDSSYLATTLTVLPVYTTTSAESANVYVDSTGKFFRSTSSEQFKKNIRDLEIDTSKIFELLPKSFEMKEDNSTHFGLIAEEVSKTIPELASYDKEGIPNGVQYQLLSVLLLEELRKQRIEIDILKTKLAIL